MSFERCFTQHQLRRLGADFLIHLALRIVYFFHFLLLNVLKTTNVPPTSTDDRTERGTFRNLCLITVAKNTAISRSPL